MNELGQFHHTEDNSDKTKKIVAGLVVVFIVAAAAMYVVESGILHPVQAQTGKAYPRGL